jgi:G2/mitotic-specific cyclin-B, other
MAEVQDDLTEYNRSEVLDWIVDVHRHFRLRDDTLYFTINLLDRFLSKRKIVRSQLQLVAISCLFIACKLEEIYPPQVNSLVEITLNVFSK